jgi:hypothetical protein
MENFQNLGWEDLGSAVVRLRRGIKTVRGVRVTRGLRRGIIRAFEDSVCRYNRKQSVDADLRSIRDGRLIKPGRKNYYETLRRCRIVRHYSTCREILNPRSRLVSNPRNGRMYPRESRMGKRLIRGCTNH